MRTYENDSARLSLVGPVGFEQALAAAAADGGEAAEQHVAAGMKAMVVETVFPGPAEEHNTVSTRLFLPARKVKEKAKKFKSQFKEDILSGTSSQSVLAMTFRQVVLSQLWNFELLLYKPGTERNMKELDHPREQVPPLFTLSSSDDYVISMLTEVICCIALESTQRKFLGNSWSILPSTFFHWLQKTNRVASSDSAVVIHKLFEDEIIANAQSLLETFNSGKANYKPLVATTKNSWWSLSANSKLEKIGGPEFITWVNEYVPAYRLQVDSNRFPELKFEGWRQIEKNKWEVLLTHTQMVDLANILDMYYEDVYTLPEKQLSCGAIAKSTNLLLKKRTVSLLKTFSITLASAVFLVIISILGQLLLPYLHNGKRFRAETQSLQSSNINDLRPQPIEASKVEEFCASIVGKIKGAFGWTGDVQTGKRIGAWIGELPVYLKSLDERGDCNEDITSTSSLLKESDKELKASAQDVASYQVVMSTEGRIIGFQPMSRVAVNQWAANPLVKELYDGRKLSPGIIEPGLKISRPAEVAVIELLMSTNPDSSFALARPFQ